MKTRFAAAMIFGAASLTGCAFSATQMNQNSITFRYDPFLANVKTLAVEASAHCAKYGNRATLATDWSAERGWRRATFNCKKELTR